MAQFTFNKPLKSYLDDEGKHEVTVSESNMQYWQAYNAARIERSEFANVEEKEDEE